MKPIVLPGLDGTNPLAFFAALGVLEVLSDRGMPARLRWQDDGGWHPVLDRIDEDIDAIIGWIDADRVSCLDDAALQLEYDGKRDLKPVPTQFRAYLDSLVRQAEPGRRRGVDWASAFATDVATDNNGNTKPTALHFTAGQQQFLKMVLELANGVTPADVREALIGPWRYSRPLPVLGWDATSTRDYALRASDPSTDKKLGVPGADWLAVRGLPSIPVVPVKTQIRTTGCAGGWKTGSFRWGLWTVPLTRELVRSTLRQNLEDTVPAERAARGIGAVLCCGIRRSDQGGYGSFEPARVV